MFKSILKVNPIWISIIVCSTFWLMIHFTEYGVIFTWVNNKIRYINNGYFYNIPISFLFFLFLFELLSDLAKNISSSLLLRLIPIIIIWIIGSIILYFRLWLNTIDISGHVVWLSILVTQSYLYKYSMWIRMAIIVVYLQILYMNFCIFTSSNSGFNGLIVGLVLSLIFVLSKFIFQKVNNVKIII